MAENKPHGENFPDEVSYANYRETRAMTLRLRRIAIAQIIRLKRLVQGRELSDVAVASKVRGATLKEVKAVREELERNGVLPDELDGFTEEKGGD